MNKICLLIHGYLTDYHDFTSLPQHLIKYYDQVILLCLPGHENKCNLKNFTKDNVFTYLDYEISKVMKPNNQVDIIGFSLGGALAWYYSLKYNFHKVVLLAPAIHNLNLNLVSDKWHHRKQLKQCDNNIYKEEIKKALQRDKEAVQFVIKNTLPKFTIGNGIEFIKIVKEINSMKGSSPVPTLIIRGELDELVKKDVIKIISDRLTGIKEIYEVPNIGHMMLRTDYEQEIIEKIIYFLER